MNDNSWRYYLYKIVDRIRIVDKYLIPDLTDKVFEYLILDINIRIIRPIV